MEINIRQILCDSCSDVAVEFDNDKVSASTLDGKVCICQSCSALGRVDADEYIRFHLLDKDELSHVDFGLLVEAYEAGQKRLDEMYDENYNLRMQLKGSK